MELTVSLDILCRVIERAREVEALVPAVDPDDASNPTDDKDMDVLEDENNETAEEELRAVLEDLADDELNETYALALVGRGSYDASEWDEALEAAAEIADDANEQALIDGLLEMPMLAGYLDAGLAAFDLSCSGIGQIG
jgi:hypothetical protein